MTLGGLERYPPPMASAAGPVTASEVSSAALDEEDSSLSVAFAATTASTSR